MSKGQGTQNKGRLILPDSATIINLANIMFIVV